MMISIIAHNVILSKDHLILSKDNLQFDKFVLSAKVTISIHCKLCINHNRVVCVVLMMVNCAKQCMKLLNIVIKVSRVTNLNRSCSPGKTFQWGFSRTDSPNFLFYLRNPKHFMINVAYNLTPDDSKAVCDEKSRMKNRPFSILRLF